LLIYFRVAPPLQRNCAGLESTCLQDAWGAMPMAALAVSLSAF
jgi:hypothetical protein